MRRFTAAAGGISRRLRFDPRRRLPALPPAPFVSRRCGRVVIKSFRPFPHDPPADETLERAQWPVIFRRDETDRIADGQGTPGSSNAMDVILRVHREIVI